MRHFEEHSYGAHCATDRHDFHQLLVGLEGALDIEVEGRGGRIQAGSICVIPAGAVHHYLALGTHNRCLTLNLADADLFPEEKPLFDHIQFRQLLDAKRNPEALLHHFSNDTRALLKPRLNLASLAARVISRLEEAWPLPRLAHEANLSERQLRRLLLRDTGLAPHQWLMGLRLERALECLKTSRASILDIALSCGFRDPAHFSRRIRAHTGQTPRQWRQYMADSDKYS